MSQTNISNHNLLPELTKEELNKITLKPEAIEHYSQPDELKKLLFERELYKRLFEEHSKRITEFQTKFHTKFYISNDLELTKSHKYKYRLTN